MRILMLHNFYRQTGGEDTCFFAERDMLSRRGDVVSTIEVHNSETIGMSGASLAVRTIWNRRAYSSVADRIREFRPDVMHCHNIFPLLSPAVYYAAKRAQVPVVQTLHNYRLLCLKAILFRNGHICETCVKRVLPWPGVLRRCYHDSMAHSASVASLLVAHRALGTWHRKVDVFIAVSAFVREQFIVGGFNADRIMVKPNVIGAGSPPGDGEAGFALVVGRLSEEKGLRTVLNVWRANPSNPLLLIVGDGPLRVLEHEFVQSKNIRFIGHVNRDQVRDLMRQASFIVAASQWHETFGMTIIEAFACGTPVIAARIGAYPEIVKHGITGFLFEPGNPDGLQEAVLLVKQSPERLRSMRRAARRCFEISFAEPENYRMLIEAYNIALRMQRQI